ncbi:MAG TPA: hypothetical protein VGM44_24785 [Polyangiaceae bacterium]
MSQVSNVGRVLLGGLLCCASVGCLGSQPPANNASNAPVAVQSSKPEGAADAVNTNPGSSNTGNGSPGPEGGPGSLGAGIGSGSGTGTGAAPGNGASVSGSVSK